MSRPTSPRLLRRLNHPLVWMAAFLAVANGYVAALGLWRTAHASQSPVNPRDRRAMPEYVAARVVDDPRPLTVLISNSQGAYDGEDASTLYPALLQARLTTTRLENWSTDGIRTVELELLTRQALRRGAKLIVLVVGASNIDPPQLATIDYGNTDIDLLLGDPSLWRMLKKSVTYAHLERDQFAARLLRAQVPLVRSRTALRDKLAVTLPDNVQQPLFGRHLDVLIRGPKAAMLGARPGHKRDAAADPSVDDAKLTPLLSTLDTLATSLAQEAGRAGARVVWCWQPVAVGRLNPQTRTEGARLYALSRPLLQSRGIDLYDLASSLPETLFIDGTHLTRDGHAAMADLMAETLADAL